MDKITTSDISFQLRHSNGNNRSVKVGMAAVHNDIHYVYCLLVGPGILISYLIGAVSCVFTALAYSEFASRVPVAGSAYTYAYASFGELLAWM